MSNAFVEIPETIGGKKVDNSLLTIGGVPVYRQRVESHQANTFGDLQADAWGIAKVSIPHSLFHGMFTFDIPASQWFMFEDSTQVYTSTNIASTSSAAVLTADASKNLVELQGRDCPRYQPNRGHLFSAALWCPSKSNDGVRCWGLATADNGVFFKLKSDGNLYACQVSGGTLIKEELIDTSDVSGFDVEKGNVYDIQYQWRGVGNYKFFINLTHVHTFQNLGTLTSLSMENPALPAYFSSEYTSEEVAMHIGCVDISSENGEDDRLQPQSAYAADSINGTDIPLICIYNPLLIGTVVNTRSINVARITLSSDKKATFKIWRTRDLSGITGATFAAIGQGSYVETDSPDTVSGATKATSVTTSKLELITALPLVANSTKEYTNPDPRIDFTMVRGDYLVITASVSVGALEAVIEWGEAV